MGSQGAIFPVMDPQSEKWDQFRAVSRFDLSRHVCVEGSAGATVEDSCLMECQESGQQNHIRWLRGGFNPVVVHGLGNPQLDNALSDYREGQIASRGEARRLQPFPFEPHSRNGLLAEVVAALFNLQGSFAHWLPPSFRKRVVLLGRHFVLGFWHLRCGRVFRYFLFVGFRIGSEVWVRRFDLLVHEFFFRLGRRPWVHPGGGNSPTCSAVRAGAATVTEAKSGQLNPLAGWLLLTERRARDSV